MSDTAADTGLWDRIHTALDWPQVLARRKQDPVALATKLAARAQGLRAKTAPIVATEASFPFLAFQNGRDRFGIALHEVREIQSLDQFTSVPRAANYIDGVIQWRGSILSLLSISKLFAIPQSGIADYHACLIVEVKACRIAVVAGEVEEILSVPQSEIKPVPPLSGDRPADWLLGVHDGNRLLLNMDKILTDERFAEGRLTPP